MNRRALTASCVAIGISVLVCPSPALAQGAGMSSLTQVRQGRSKAVTSSDPDFNSNLDRRTYIKPGETMVLAEIRGPAAINHIWLTFNDAGPNWLEAGGSARPEEIVLRMYWDDAEHPNVEAPLGDFFAAGFGLRREVRSMPIYVEGGDGYNSFWQIRSSRAAGSPRRTKARRTSAVSTITSTARRWTYSDDRVGRISAPPRRTERLTQAKKSACSISPAATATNVPSTSSSSATSW